MWECQISHEGLNKYRVIKGRDKDVVERKVAVQQATWDEMWEKKLEKEELAQNKLQNIEEAEELTREAKECFEQLESLLLHTLEIDDSIEWDSLKDNSVFDENKPSEPQLIQIPYEPKKSDNRFKPNLNILDNMFSSWKEKKVKKASDLFKQAYSKWGSDLKDAEENNNKLKENYDLRIKEWKEKKEGFVLKQNEKNAHIDKLKEQHILKQPDAVVDYCEMVLANSDYPDYFPQDYDLDYNENNKILVIEYWLPSLDEIPTLKEVKFIQSKDEFKESHITASAKNKLYDSIIYQITLRSLHEIYESDTVGAIESVVFNGWVHSIDKATGKKIDSCIVTVQANREEFEEINLENVEPKLCFKNLKGVGSSKLHSITPVAPLMKIDKEDSRFVLNQEVVNELDESYNLAAMDWEDFEHLIRELFEKEFTESGGEVKVTQASRDGGVDAIAFDPDPIRGGKIVIQAKRYTNVVGVSAVRDLYGTVMNEGATKGILVTTADYGPDAYGFAKGKPLTLLNGGNLLHLLAKHGHKAKIDIKEAKLILAEKEKENND